jgi:predicted kinase
MAAMSPREVGVLIVFGGLPGTGKTTISLALARRLDAVHLRIDSIEQAISNSTIAPASLEDAGYLVGYAVAEDNLRLGRTVIADSVNPWRLTRAAWLSVAERAAVDAIEIETICSDADEHRRRIESRVSDIPGLRLPTWKDVVAREYHPWTGKRIVIDTAVETTDEGLAKIRAALRQG